VTQIILQLERNEPRNPHGGTKHAGDKRKLIEAAFAENPDRTDREFMRTTGATRAFVHQPVTVLRLKAMAAECAGEVDYVPAIAKAIEKQLGIYLARAFEWKDAMAAADFCRFLTWSGIVSLCEKRGVHSLRRKMDDVIEACSFALQNANPSALIKEFQSSGERLARIEAVVLKFERPEVTTIEAGPVQGPVLLTD
jgi:hypothetical protein